LPVPNVGGNSDVGVELGFAFTLARFHEEEQPYRWLLGGVFSASFKDDVDGFRSVQQYHMVRFDVPNLFSGRLRLDNRLNFSRNIVAHYYGLGNASAPAERVPTADPALQNEYISEELRFRSLARVKTGTLFDAAFALNLRYDRPTTYADSQLVSDVAHEGVVGSQQALLTTLAAGVILDTRDNEFVPRRGVYYQLGGAGTLGSAERVAYGEVGTNLASYISLARPVIFATRVIASFQFGRVPFYDAQQTNVLNPQYMVGSSVGVRGIPLGRYAGHIKVLVNYELRTLFIPRFRVAAWQLQVGTTTFFDAGRVWSNYGTPELDGTALGLKYGVGGGFFFQFDRSSVFRAEVAHSPHTQYSAVPFAWYLSNALIF
jgi:outer membrane protein assembly factor BamA